MLRILLRTGFFFAFILTLFAVVPGHGQSFGRKARKAALKTRNKQISRFTVRTDFSKSKKYISFGVGMGASNYFGDLAPRSRRGSSDIGYTRTYSSLFYLHRIHPHITVRASLTHMRIMGDDFSVADLDQPNGDERGRFMRNLSFRNDIFEAAGVGIFELFPTDRGFLRRNFINPYGIFGLSFFRHNPKAKTPIEQGQTSKWVNLRPLGTEGQYTGIPGTPRPYSLWQVGIPLGVGIRYRLEDKWDLSLEFCYRFVFTDYLDDVSGKYPADTVYRSMLESGNTLGVKMSNRSAENTSARGGESRLAVFRRWKNNALSNVENFTPDPNQKDQVFRRINGNENGASPRGNKRRDYWIATAVHLAYILEIKQKPPKFR
jgi:hypothetical protein